jgi:hypothetical protein
MNSEFFYCLVIKPVKSLEFNFLKITGIFKMFNSYRFRKYPLSLLFFTATVFILTQCKCNRSTGAFGLTGMVNRDAYPSESIVIPTPDEMLKEILSQNTNINPLLVNSLSNADKYLSTNSQALNLGVYVADFNYLNLYNNRTDALVYLVIMRNLARKIKIDDNLNAFFFERVQNNLVNNDSLKVIFREIFFDMSGILEKSNRQHLYVLISLGAFTEILYLSAMSVTKFSEYDTIVNRIFDQKYVFDNIYKYASKFKKDKDVGSILIQLDNIRLVIENAENKSIDTNITVNTPVLFPRRRKPINKTDETTFINLKKMISLTRQNIISIFSS